MKNIIDHELNARIKYLENNKEKLFDQISRSYDILRSAHIISSDESMNCLSFIRLAIDLGYFDSKFRKLIDFLYIEIQPGHIQFPDCKMSVELRDIKRAELLRNNFKKLPPLNFDK